MHLTRLAAGRVRPTGRGAGRGGSTGGGVAGGEEEDRAWRAQLLAEIRDTRQRVQASEAVISAFTVRGPPALSPSTLPIRTEFSAEVFSRVFG